MKNLLKNNKFAIHVLPFHDKAPAHKSLIELQKNYVISLEHSRYLTNLALSDYLLFINILQCVNLPQ